MKVGLMLDWIVYGVCKVFGFDFFMIEVLFIKGLFDSCTNSYFRLNIFVEKCYDKKDDGLKMFNLWVGYYVLVNFLYEV